MLLRLYLYSLELFRMGVQKASLLVTLSDFPVISRNVLMSSDLFPLVPQKHTQFSTPK